LTIIIRRHQKESNEAETNFEQQLLIHRPEAYKQYKETQKENEELGIDTVEWRTPDSVDELRDILGIIKESNRLAGIGLDVPEEEEEEEEEEDFFGINTSLLGEEEDG